MFDYHIHTKLSFDSTCEPAEMIRRAEELGLAEICFTDHFDAHNDPEEHHDFFTAQEYRAVYDGISSPKVRVRHGVELGLTWWNVEKARELLASYPFDYVIGSVHFAGKYDPYFQEYWEPFDHLGGFENYLEHTLKCVKLHQDFDVLGHLTYAAKSPHNPTHQPIRYEDFSELCDEIMRTLAQNGKGMEINTSGKDRVGEFLPSLPFLKRFRELGGEIVTIGSDAHLPARLGQYHTEAIALAREVFGYVCTFEQRKPIFHKL